MKVRVFLGEPDESETLELAGIPRTGETIVRSGEGFKITRVEHTPDEEVKVRVRAKESRARLIA